MVILKKPVRCKLEPEGHKKEQIMVFCYQGIEISSDMNTQEVRKQAMKGARISESYMEQ